MTRARHTLPGVLTGTSDVHTQGQLGLPNKSAHSAAKGAVLAWTRTVNQEWATCNTRVNAIAPAIWTPMYDKTRAEMNPEQLTAHDTLMAKVIRWVAGWVTWSAILCPCWPFWPRRGRAS